MGKIVSINVSRKVHAIKLPVQQANFVKDQGIESDAHAGKDHRQVSLMMMENIAEQRAKVEAGKAQLCPETSDKKLEIVPGVYAENLTTQDIDLLSLKIGDELKLGSGILLRVTQIGKECHTHCQVYHQVGDCIMPRQGIFCEVVQGGSLSVGDGIEKD